MHVCVRLMCSVMLCDMYDCCCIAKLGYGPMLMFMLALRASDGECACVYAVCPNRSRRRQSGAGVVYNATSCAILSENETN